jgi:hypothetical protein
MVRNMSTRRPRAGKRSRVVVDIAISSGNSPKVLPKLEKVSHPHGILSLLDAISHHVLPRPQKSVERCFRHTTSRQERRAENLMVISAGDYGLGKGNTIRGILETIVR